MSMVVLADARYGAVKERARQ